MWILGWPEEIRNEIEIPTKFNLKCMMALIAGENLSVIQVFGASKAKIFQLESSIGCRKPRGFPHSLQEWLVKDVFL